MWMFKTTLCWFGCALVLASVADSEPTPSSVDPSALTASITAMDKKMFDAFNAHDVDTLMGMFAQDLEFYRDTGGLTDHQHTRQGFDTMFGNSPDIKRTLVPGSLQVYPIKDFGAIEVGTHRFCHKENGKDDCGTFPFILVWKKSGDSWQVSRVISYGHH